MRVIAAKCKLSTGPVGVKSIVERKGMWEAPTIEVLQYAATEAGDTRTYTVLEFVLIQTDAPLIVTTDSEVFTCNGLLILDSLILNLGIETTQPDTNVQLVLGRRS